MTGFTSNYNNKILGSEWNDIYLDDNLNIAFNSNNDEIVENCYHQLELLLGEYDFNVSIGIPWDKYLSSNTPQGNAIRNSIYNALVAVKGVNTVSNINMDINKKDAILNITVFIILSNGLIEQLILSQFLS